MKRNPNLPLTETTFYILLALYKPAHGYGIIQEIERMSAGQVKIAAGTMYGAIDNLLKLNWIEEIPSQDKRRRVYQLTALGDTIISLEVERIRQLDVIATNLGY